MGADPGGRYYGLYCCGSPLTLLSRTPLADPLASCLSDKQVFGAHRYEGGGACCLARHIACARRTTASWSALVAMASRCSSCSCVSPLSTLSAAKTWAKNSPQPWAMTALEAPSASISLLSVAPKALYRRSSLFSSRRSQLLAIRSPCLSDLARIVLWAIQKVQGHSHRPHITQYGTRLV